jgi:translation initiation factor 2B subunit (eIF-2B alpha/beta/delta family)
MTVSDRIARLAADRQSGASEILAEAIAILRATPEGELADVARALRAAQPSMAPLWNATAAALHGELERFAQRAARAPAAIARFAADLLVTGAPPDRPLAIVTISYSGTVAHALEALAANRPLRVACAEGRPALEGQRMAARLAAAGIPITFYTDAAIGVALADASAVLIGADAVAPAWFLNKVGTRMLAAAAQQQGVPTYVLAGRDKFLTAEASAQLSIRSGAAEEVWPEIQSGITTLNPYFEQIPLELTSAVITDVGALSPGDI